MGGLAGILRPPMKVIKTYDADLNPIHQDAYSNRQVVFDTDLGEWVFKEDLKPPTTKPPKCGCGSGLRMRLDIYNRPIILCKQCVCRNGCNKARSCKGCRSCQECGCYCRLCEGCGKKHFTNPCPSCGKCKSICICRGMPKALPTELKDPSPVQCLLNTLPRAMGVELELSEFGGIMDRYNGNKTIPGITYKLVRDGSVKPSEMEMVIDPLAGDDFIKGMIQLSQECYSSEAKVNETCGLHVHVNARDFSYWHLKRLLHLWEKVEKDIYGFMIDKEREHSRPPTPWHFCRPTVPLIDTLKASGLNSIKKTVGLKALFMDVLYDLDKDKNEKNKGHSLLAKRNHKYEQARYYGLNLHAWFQRGTIEFRHKEGTFEVDELVCWPLMCGWIVHLATILGTKEISSITGLRDLAMNHMPKMVSQYVEAKYNGIKLVKGIG